MKTYVIAAMALMGLAGCEPMSKIGLDWPLKQKPRPAPVVQDVTDPEDAPPGMGVDPGGSVVPDPVQPVGGVGFLGETVASLGDPGREGFWIETALVTTLGKGHVTYAKTGRTVKVQLIPIAGPATGGSRLSLAVMRLLDAPLTGLPEVRVYRD